MDDTIKIDYTVSPDDFTRAGEASSDLKNMLKQLNVAPDIVRRIAIAMYEGEINMVIHARGGQADVTVYRDRIEIVLTDHGPGIADIALAMQ